MLDVSLIECEFGVGLNVDTELSGAGLMLILNANLKNLSCKKKTLGKVLRV